MLKKWVAVLVGWLCLWSMVASASAAETTVSAKCAILYEPTTGLVLFEKNADERRPMASTTKLMTALIAAETRDPDGTVTVTAEAVRVEGSSLGLRAGDQLSVRDLITGLLVVSGNDAANVIALTVCDSLPAFAERMNRRAAALGMTDTGFVTPSGLDAEGHFTTARDMAKLAAAVLDNPLLAEICRMKTATVHIGNPPTPRVLTNHNRLLFTYEGTVGLKTGFTKKAGRCLVSAVHKNGITLIAVTLNAPNDWQDHTHLYDAGFSQIERVEMTPPALPRLWVGGGTKRSIALQTVTPPATILPSGRADDLRVSVSLARYVWAPLRGGDTVGRVTYTLDDRVIAETDIVAAEGVAALPETPFWVRFGRCIRQLMRLCLT